MSEPASAARRSGFLTLLIGLAVIAAIAAAALHEVGRTRPVREAMGAYTRLIAAVNRQDLDGLRALCTRRYASTHPFVAASPGGVIGLPRTPPHGNFRAWREAGAVRLCPGGRVGVVYQFVREDGRWKFDGPVGMLRASGDFIPFWPKAPAPLDADASRAPAPGGAE